MGFVNLLVTSPNHRQGYEGQDPEFFIKHDINSVLHAGLPVILAAGSRNMKIVQTMKFTL